MTATLALFIAGCGVGSGEGPTAVGAQALTVHDSCGTSFTVRDEAGTTRLTISTGIDSFTSVDAGPLALGPNAAGGGYLELGESLDVWPCHDIGDDFDDEKVRETWRVISGSVVLLDPALADESGGGGSSPVSAVLERVELESDDGDVLVFEDVALVNDRWGFYGG